MGRLVRVAKRVVVSPLALTNFIRYRNGPSRYRTLRRLVARSRPCTIVEIGVWQGDAARQMIKAAGGRSRSVRYWGFDLFEERAIPEQLEREISPDPPPMQHVYKSLAVLGVDVVLVAGDSTRTLPETDLPPIEFAFIDGGHSYETVSADWRNIQPKLAPGAVVVFDDYTNRDAVTHEGFGVRRLVDEIDEDWRVELLEPINRFPRDYGSFETRLAKVTRRTE